jgi:WD40 repeat protein
MIGAATKNLFVGPRPIAKGEKIFGREPEIRRLTHLLLAERIVLLHSPSGAGKTSLIQAGVLPALAAETDDEFYVPPTIRLSLLAPGSGLTSAEDPRANSFPSIEEHLETRVKPQAEGKCICLVFDQFEECVTFLPEDGVARQTLFRDLRRTLANPNVWALFAVREDFLAPVLELGSALPTRFKQTFRLDFLGKNDAQHVICQTAELGGYTFADKALLALVNDLATVNVQSQDGKFSSRTGEYVEPLHLQVACRHILQRLPAGITEIGSEILNAQAEGARPESTVDEALAAYYRSELSEIAGSKPGREQEMRFWTQENLIDPTGIRLPLRQGPEATAGLSNALIDQLYDSYLVRKERRLNATWYELAHDRLVKPILGDNKEWFDRNLGLLGRSCRDWVKSGRSPNRLLASRDLTKALRQRQTKARPFSPDEIEFLTASKRARRRAQLRFWMPIGTSLAIAIVFAIIASWFWRTNHDLTYYHQFSALRPLYAPWTPASADRSILFATQLAQDLGQKKTPIDSLLAGDVIGLLDRALDRRKRLQETHWNYEFPVSNRGSVGNPVEVYAMAFSPDGQVLALGDKLGRLRFLIGGALTSPIALSGGKIRAVAFSGNGSRLAVGSDNGFVSVIKLGKGLTASAITNLPYPGSADGHNVWSCSWSSSGNLAAACQDGKIYIWPELPDRQPTQPADQPVIVENRINDRLVPVHAAAWNNAGTFLALGDGGGDLRVWDGTTLSPAVRAHESAIWSVAWSKDDRIACGSWDRAISVWKVTGPGAAPSNVNRKIQAHDHWVRGVVWTNDDQGLASIGDDGFVKFWSADLNQIGAEQSPTPQIWKLAYNPTSRIVASADLDGAIRLYGTELPKPQTHGNHKNDSICLGFKDDAVLSFDLEGSATVFHPASGQQEEFSLPNELRSGIQAARYQPSLDLFVVGYSSPAQIVTWNPHDTGGIRHCPVRTRIVSLDCSPVAPIVAFVTSSAVLGLRSLPDLQNIPGQPDLQIKRSSEAQAPGRVAWSLAENFLTVVLHDSEKNVSEIARFAFDGHSLNQLAPLKVAAHISSICWHPTEPVVAIGTTSGSVFLGSFKAGLTEQLPGHDNAVRTLAWSADGQRLFTGGADRSAKVWEYNPVSRLKLTLLTTLQPPNGAILAIAPAPDRSGIYLAGTDPRIWFYSKQHYIAAAILDRARRMVNRNMLGAEWLRYTENDAAKQQHYEKTFPDLPSLLQSEIP